VNHFLKFTALIGWRDLLKWPEGITTWAIILTLGAIVWQSYETRRATNSQRKKDRARLSIIHPLAPLETLETRIDGNDLMEIYLHVVKEGESTAYDVRAYGYVTVTGMDVTSVKFVRRGAAFLQIDNTIHAATPDDPVRVPLASARFGYFFGINSQKMKDVRGGNALLHVIGELTYRDLFDAFHTTPFHFTWQATDESLREPGDTSVGFWWNRSRKPS
jgi:hypothetical protein